ncbi:12225_t:CDS:2 [Entrophospora sp. SA101]|nr:2058_t:CDS:2 [Entrophospora sp. SA101]CAJ0883679.1 12225_t:CDS:2 [Entrophospora sp. SA101]
MGSTTIVDEIKDILNAEVYIDLDKLRELSRRGIPKEVRGAVWKYLLEVNPADRSQELTSTKAKYQEYSAIDKENFEITRIRGEVTYLNHNRDIEYYPALIHLCGPFVYCIRNEAEVYYCFERLMGTLVILFIDGSSINSYLDEYNSTHNINERVANFMTLFRSIIPDLCNYFEEEEVDINDWSSSWLQYLLAKELQFDNLLRLWDTYFSINDPIEFHSYVCLAVLKHNKEYLEELEQSEIRTLLLRLPSMDMGQIINQAFNIRHEILEKEISDSL